MTKKTAKKFLKKRDFYTRGPNNNRMLYQEVEVPPRHLAKSIKSRHHVTGRELEMEEEGGRLEKDNYICVKNSIIQSFQCIKNVPFLKESKRANMYRIINMYP